MIHAAVIPAPHQPVELREFSEPDIAPGGMSMRTEVSEVCGTHVHLWHGRLAGVPYPLIPGHGSIGFADKVRGEVIGGDARRLRAGNRVVFYDVHRAGRRCYACVVSGTPTSCPSRRVYGFTGAADGLFGGWSEAISGGRYVIAGHYTDAGASSINAHQHIKKHLEILGCWGSEAGHFLRAVKFLERHAAHVPWRDIGAKVYALDELNESHVAAAAYHVPKALVAPQRRSVRSTGGRVTDSPVTPT